MTVRYFAYGSNMKEERLKQRVPSAHRIDVAYLYNYRILINKVSGDQSTKANIAHTASDSVVGVLYEIDEEELRMLDRIEQGYDRKEVEVKTMGGTCQRAWTYLSGKVADYVRPHCWYMKYIIDGAIENNLPEKYIARLRSIRCQSGAEAYHAD